jgi:hypothetical protein
MKKLALIYTLLVSTPVISPAAYPVTIDFTESATTVAVGDVFDLQLRISDVSALLDPALRSFDVEVGFSESQLHFEGVQFGLPPLGDLLNLTGLADQSVSGPFHSGLDRSSVRIAETSNDFSAPLQPGEFVLAVLSFRALAAGTRDIGVLDAVLDGFDGEYPPPFLGKATVAAVPEPAAFAWLIAALGLAAAVRRGPRSG